MRSYLSILKIVLHGRSAGKILLATLVSFTFSIAVILCTFGLMDGFDHLLKSGLRHSSGDILITSPRGFFLLEGNLAKALDKINLHSYSGYVQTEAFALNNGLSKGVLVKGVEGDSFSQTTGLEVLTPPESIVIGKELARELNLKIGEELAITFAKGNDQSSTLPVVKTFKISGVVAHGIYQKDLRFVYVNRNELAEFMNLGRNVNTVVIAVADPNKPLASLDPVREKQLAVRKKLSSEYHVRPFWSEYSYLIEAVKEEKFFISLILQLIVVVAVFNIVAFVIYIMEKKAQDFFFLRAVGLSLKSLTFFWFVSILVMWAASCVGAWFLAQFFNWSLANLSFLQIPGEIYVLSSLQIRLDLDAYLTVYLLSLLWVFLAGLFGYWRLKRRPIVQGLRQEFS